MDITISLQKLAEAMSEKDLLKIIGAFYADEAYCESYLDDDLDWVEEFVDTDSHDILTNIQNTLANIDRCYGDEDEDYCEDCCEDECEEYCEDEDDYWESYNEDEEDETQRLIEENRRRNEEALGL